MHDMQECVGFCEEVEEEKVHDPSISCFLEKGRDVCICAVNMLGAQAMAMERGGVASWGTKLGAGLTTTLSKTSQACTIDYDTLLVAVLLASRRSG